MQWSDDITIETPEQIDVSLEIAGLGSRFVAQVIDWLMKWSVLGVTWLLLIIVVSQLGIALQSLQFLLIFLLSAAYLFMLGYDVYFELQHNGQTPGKKYAGIRVIRDGGGAIDFQAACVRNLLGIADFLPSFYVLGGLVALFNSRGQRLGDMAAGTIVVRERVVEPPHELERDIEELARDEFQFSADQLTACTHVDRHVLRSFFQRCRDMDRPSRAQLAFNLTATFLQKTSYRPIAPIMADDEAVAFLASLYRALDRWARQQQG